MPPTIFAAWPQLAIACVVLALAQCVYVLFGFGAGLITVGTLALVFPEIQDVVVLLMLVSLPAEVFVVVKSFKHINWRGVAWLLLGVAVGVPLGAVVLRLGNATWILALLGVFLLVVGITFLRLPDGRSIRWPTWVAPPVGLVSGVLGGMFGTGGPPLIVYYQLAGVEKASFRGNLMAIFAVVTLVRLVSYSVGGLITEPRLWSALFVVPAVAVGAWLGHRAHVEIREATFRKLVSVFLAAIGVVLVLRTFLS